MLTEMESEGIRIVQSQQLMNCVQGVANLHHQFDFAVIDNCLVISITLFVYEWLLVFADEVKHIWTSRWTFVKVLYLWTRYSPIADTIFGFLTHFVFLTPAQCKLNDSINSFLVAAGIYSSELVLVWRTFALWQDSKRVKYSLAAIWILMFPVGLYSLIAFILSTVYAPQPFATQPGCNLIGASPVIAGDFISLTVLEISIVILTVVKGVQHVISAPGLAGVHYVRILYRDGVLFFVYLAVLSLANVLAPFLGSKSNALLLPTFLRIMHSALCCRVILHLRSAASADPRLLPSGFPPFPVADTVPVLQLTLV
ncbi:hypothetical protein BDY19DRAFT_416479 [Irpex rosettiformis]|uniref:Uncharacterized protein n=1 Tax=Irpex rosettiformis TaxID=378272 RepID=A0ACB8UHS1_9APHY|nr:hypothetical protein BDY19DRAFT_416479 [Irpex rosettiformis]